MKERWPLVALVHDQTALHNAYRKKPMGTYDTYGQSQLKVGPCTLDHYELGAKVPIPDGIYLGHPMAVVIVGGRFVAEFPRLVDKWGGLVSYDEVFAARHPSSPAIAAMHKRAWPHNSGSGRFGDNPRKRP